MGAAAVSVLIVDDQAPFRRAAAAVVKITGGFEVVGEAESGEEAVELVGTLAPQLVLMDINMGGISGIEAARRITSGWPEVAVVLLSTYQAEDLPADAGTSGALAYVHKEDFGARVLEDVWAQRAGGRLAM
ncbi:MAG TPA: response regulator transcription factor [Acidimicrobiales bacterium]|nr:response regulator transcription factor [Acidimicrobiales bacterium]